MRLRILILPVVLFTLFAFGCASQQTSPPDQGSGWGEARPDISRYRYEIYYVKKDDTLRSIARRLEVSWREILRINDCSPEDLEVGETLLIPFPLGSDRHVKQEQFRFPALPGQKQYRGITIVLDPGHGGKDPGAISPIGLQEKDVNLAVSERVEELLKRSGFTVIMTRKSDAFIELDRRAEIANKKKADLFVSIHADSSPRSSPRGYTLYVSRAASPKGRSAAKAVAKGLRASGIASRGVREADYRVLVRTECPAILVEMGFLSNKREAKMLRSRATQKRLAECIVAGIKNFFGP
ncbi:MAG: N-acetylmuramoyl-L-alanine amidase [Candidatus Brocadiia bacterium]